MNEEIKLERIIETIYFQILQGLPSDMCNKCPVVTMLSGLTGTLKHENNIKIAMELGISAVELNCPCSTRSEH